MTREEAIYIAGLFDGEGCITLVEYKRKRGGITHILRACIRMTNYDVVHWLSVVAGGSFYPLIKARNPKHRPCSEWSVTGRNAVKILSEIYPYLKVKRIQAEIAFKYGETIQQQHSGRVLPEGILQKRNGLHRAISVCNKLGVQQL